MQVLPSYSWEKMHIRKEKQLQNHAFNEINAKHPGLTKIYN